MELEAVGMTSLDAFLRHVKPLRAGTSRSRSSKTPWRCLNQVTMTFIEVKKRDGPRLNPVVNDWEFDRGDED